MAVRSSLQQRVKATRPLSDDEHSTSSQFENETTSPPYFKNAGGPLSDSEETNGEAPSLGEDVATISFGALARAQEDLTKHKRDHNDGGIISLNPAQVYDNTEAMERKAGKSDNREHLRSSKHAPAEMSSKKAVSRKRDVVPTTKRDVRDPRFERVGGTLDEAKARKNYSFLNGYRDSELLDLKIQIRQTKDGIAKERLKRSLLSMESRKKAQQMKDQEQEIQKSHRVKEKELVKQGKRPFHLKKGEQKRMALLQRFEGIKGKRLGKIIERRRKKNAQKERRDMPEARRAYEDSVKEAYQPHHGPRSLSRR
ncbi:MAG: hypothetical protein Q9182_001694 [Xanthomendoza sp. 2 TL-2023]